MKRTLTKIEISKERDALSRASFEENVIVYCKRLYNFLYGLCRDEELSKDLLQDTMLRAQYQFMHGFYSEKGLVWCWLRTIAQNILYKHYRTQSRIKLKSVEEKQQICENLGWQSISVEMETPDAGLLPGIDRRQTKERLSEHISLLLQSDFRFFKLSAEEKTLVSGRHLQMKSFKELACIYGVPISTVMSRYYTAMKKMQRQIIEWEAKGIFQEELNLQALQKMQQLQPKAKKIGSIPRPKPGRPRKNPPTA